jgi:hypothetical protein
VRSIANTADPDREDCSSRTDIRFRDGISRADGLTFSTLSLRITGREASGSFLITISALRTIIMAKIEKIDKWLEAEDSRTPTTGKKKNLPSLADEASVRQQPRKSERKSASKGLNQVTKIQLLLKEAPDNPLFLGKKKLSIEEPKRGFFQRRKYPDLHRLRVDLNTLTNDGKVAVHSRQKVRADLKKYPEVSDLHVINAVYTYQDIPRPDKKQQVSEMAMNQLNEHQLQQLKTAIHEIALAFLHGGLSVFNVNWFMKIYIDYLNVFKGRLTYEYRNISHRNNQESVMLAKKLKQKQLEVIEMLQIKERFGGIKRLGRILNGTTYLSDSFSPQEIRKAVQALKAGDDNRVIVEERRANKIFFVLMTMLFLLAKVPIMRHLVEDVLATIPDDDAEFTLRKRMVVTIIMTTDFEIAMCGGDSSRLRQAANSLYGYCLETINRYLRNNLLREQYEIDPFLKGIRLVKNADGLFGRNEYREMLHQAYGFLKTIKGEANQLKDKNREIVIELASKYTYQLDVIMDRYGWIGEHESQSWQNRDN